MARKWMSRFPSSVRPSKVHRRSQARRLFMECLETRRVLSTWHVDVRDPDCDDVGGAPFCSIQAAIDAAGNGDTIRVARGTYAENVVLNKELTLQGRSGAVIDGSATGTVVEIIASGATLRGFDITNGQNGVVLRDVSDVRVYDNDIFCNTDNGLELMNSDNNRIQDNDVYDNTGNGVVVDSDSHGNRFWDNEAEDNFFGLQVFGNSNVFQDNEVEENSASGFSVFGNDNKFEDNEVEENRQNGFDVFGSGNEFEDNEVKENGIIGFAVFGNDNQFEDNEVEESFVGFAIFGSGNELEENEIEESAVGIADVGRNTELDDNDEDDIGGVPSDLTIAQIVVTSAIGPSGEFSTLLAALTAAGQLGTVNVVQDLTVFAPTNAAFAALPAGTLGDLLADPQGALTDILLYHVATPAQTATDITTAGSVVTLLGPPIAVTGTPTTTVILNGSVTVLAADIAATNGIVHVVDSVLIPPTT